MKADDEELTYRQKLYKTLYIVCMNKIDPAFQKDGETVRALRDNLSRQWFEKYYADMEDKELEEMIQMVDDLKPDPVTDQQLKTLFFYMFECALVYEDFSCYSYRDTETLELHEGNAVRAYLLKLHKQKKNLPTNIIKKIYSNWMNPYTNKFLIEGQYRKSAVDASKFYYKSLTKEEANYLIQRYMLILESLVQSGRTRHTKEELSSN